jgi:hypothetical protein
VTSLKVCVVVWRFESSPGLPLFEDEGKKEVTPVIKNLLSVTVHDAHEGISYPPHGPPIVNHYEVCPGFWRTYIKPSEMPAEVFGTLLIVPSSVRATYPNRSDLVSPANVLSATESSITCNGFEVNDNF